MFRRLWLVVPALGLYAADIGLTLAGQPSAYWGGDYSQAVEHNPLAYPILARHPIWFVGAGLAWAAIFSIVIVLCVLAMDIGIYTIPIFGKAAYCYLFFRRKRAGCSWASPIKHSVTEQGYFCVCSDNSVCGSNSNQRMRCGGLKGRPFRPSDSFKST